MMATSVYPEIFGSDPVEWVAYCGDGECAPGADLREMYLIFYLDNTGDPRVQLEGPCGVCGSKRMSVAAVAVDCLGGSMRVCFRCLDQSGLLCEYCMNALVIGEVLTWEETAKPDALLDVCERCRSALEVEDGGP